MQANVKTVSFLGVSVVGIDVQLQIINGLPSFTIVGLPDKAVAESRERIRSSLFSMGIALPAKRITVNLAPADVQKEGSHYDLPIAIALLSAMGIIDSEDIANTVALGELSLNGAITRVPGVLPAAIFAKSAGMVLICPEECAQEAAWIGEGTSILAPKTLLSIVNHFRGQQILPKIVPKNISFATTHRNCGCFSDVKGQLMAKRALEIAASGGHNVLMLGPPGVGKSLLASRVPTILPDVTPEEALEITMIHSIAGKVDNESGLITERPFRAPHHSASLVSIVGGGPHAKPGEISLAHRGVLFLDELPEFSRSALESLRQPLESGTISIARANSHISYPARIQLIAAMNPCRCGYLGVTGKECNLAPKCGKNYLRRISGPLLDRIDIFIDVPDVKLSDFTQSKENLETSETIKKRVVKAREIQTDRYKNTSLRTNSEAEGHELEKYITEEARQLLYTYVDKARISARGYYRVIKLARTIADMDESDSIGEEHISEALSYRHVA